MMKQPENLKEAIQILTPVVRKLARKYTRNHYHVYEDLMQDGYMGICQAWERFDSKRNTAFTTYAYFYIRKRMQDTITPNWKHDNNTRPLDWSPEGSYNESFDEFAAKHEFNKLNEYDKQLISMRMEGYTFAEIAEEVGAKSLGKVRNHILAIQERLAS